MAFEVLSAEVMLIVTSYIWLNEMLLFCACSHGLRLNGQDTRVAVLDNYFVNQSCRTRFATVPKSFKLFNEVVIHNLPRCTSSLPKLLYPLLQGNLRNAWSKTFIIHSILIPDGFNGLSLALNQYGRGDCQRLYVVIRNGFAFSIGGASCSCTLLQNWQSVSFNIAIRVAKEVVRQSNEMKIPSECIFFIEGAKCDITWACGVLEIPCPDAESGNE